MPNEKSQEPIKVTDKRLFTANGELKQEYRNEVTPIDPEKAKLQHAEAVTTPGPVAPPPEPVQTDRRFLTLLQLLDANVYNALELARRGYGEGREAARQMIDLTESLEEKTTGRLSPEETESLKKLLGEAKLRFMQITKGIKV